MNQFLQNNMMFFQQNPFISFFLLLATILAILIASFTFLLIFEAFIGLFFKKPEEKSVAIESTPFSDKTTDGGAASCAVICVACI